MNESRGQAARLEQSQAVIELSSRAVHMNSGIFMCLCNAESKMGSSICFIAWFLYFLMGKSMPQAKNLLPKIMDQEARFQHW